MTRPDPKRLSGLPNQHRQSSDGLRTIRTDEGADSSHSMKNFLGRLKIQHPVDAHGQIGRVERVNRTIQDGANAAMGADQRVPSCCL